MQIWKNLADIYLQIYRQVYRQILSADWTIGRTLHEDLIHGYDDEEESWANVSTRQPAILFHGRNCPLWNKWNYTLRLSYMSSRLLVNWKASTIDDGYLFWYCLPPPDSPLTNENIIHSHTCNVRSLISRVVWMIDWLEEWMVDYCHSWTQWRQQSSICLLLMRKSLID